MFQNIFLLFSMYKQGDKSKPINWATSAYLNVEHAKARQAEIGNREDMEEVFLQDINVEGLMPFKELLDALTVAESALFYADTEGEFDKQATATDVKNALKRVRATIEKAVEMRDYAGVKP